VIWPRFVVSFPETLNQKRYLLQLFFFCVLVKRTLRVFVTVVECMILAPSSHSTGSYTSVG
jgi:hypothetical protein